MRNIFLKKSYKKCGEKTIRRTFSKKLISGSIVERFTQFVFIVCQVEGYRGILKLSCRPPVFTPFKVFNFLKKKMSTASLPEIFSMIFEEKYFSFYILLTDHVSLSDCLYFV